MSRLRSDEEYKVGRDLAIIGTVYVLKAIPVDTQNEKE